MLLRDARLHRVEPSTHEEMAKRLTDQLGRTIYRSQVTEWEAGRQGKDMPSADVLLAALEIGGMTIPRLHRLVTTLGAPEAYEREIQRMEDRL